MHPASSPRPHWSFGELIALVAAGIISTYAADDWIAGAALLVLWLIWKYLRDQAANPVLAMALTFQWAQVTAGIWYFALAGRRLETMDASDYRPMVWMGLGCVLTLAAGLWLGTTALAPRRRASADDAGAGRLLPIAWPGLLLAYVVALALQGGLQRIAYDYPSLTQPILAVRFVRLAILFVILRRLSRPVLRWPWISALVLLEVALGLTGYFAGFREPLVMAAIALYEAFDYRSIRHWLVTASVLALSGVVAVMWMDVRVQYRTSFSDEEFAESRQAQMDEMTTLASGWWRESHDASDVDKLVDRMWAVYYPALAVSRVPSVLPHTDGALLTAALQHVFNPRLFFPDKPELVSDSEMVRKYSGVWVAGTEQDTSIAFGYAAESYLDFGVPLMFLPSLVFGLLMGIAYQYLAGHIAHHELRAGVLAVIFWLSLYLFERSWVKTLGLSGTLLIYIGGPTLLLDYYMSRSERRVQQMVQAAQAISFGRAAPRP